MNDIFCLFKGTKMNYEVKETKGVTGLVPGAAGVFTYHILDKEVTLAVMFLHDTLINTNFVAALYNVKVYPGLDINANYDLYFKMLTDNPHIANGKKQHLTNLGSGFSGRGKISISDPPTLEIEIQMAASK